MTLAGKVAAVTGAARGIGAAVATRLAAEGAAVAVLDLDGDAAGATAAQIANDHGVPTSGVAVDVGERRAVEAAAGEVERTLGPLDILVNNAGIDVIESFLESKAEDWERIVRVNLFGVFTCCHVVLPGMVRRGRGRVINIGSDAGRVGSSGEAVYSATKGGVIAFTKTLAREVARSGVTVNCVCPGPTDTALLGQVTEADPRLYESLIRAIPLRRVAQPADIAPAVAFLAADASGYITGQTLSVSGGLTMC